MPIEALTATYLEGKGFQVRKAEELGGGVSNVVLRVETDEECLVFKQSLPKLRVAEEWLFDQKRIINERRCMEILGDLTPGAAPKVRFHDDENFIFGMTCAPSGGVLWKKALLDGDTDPCVAERVGALLAEMHQRAAMDARARQWFAANEVFIQGRIDPYHRKVAQVHPDLAALIDAEVERMLAHRVTLVHGDYSPKNLFVYPDRVLMLDFEVAHWGDPAFDVAFCLTHLLLKVIHFPARRGEYLRVAQSYWRGYSSVSEPRPEKAIESNTIRELGCLMLARIDGKSKEDYITNQEEKEEARGIARWLITSPPTNLNAIWERMA
jgi:aminoglycoside phosphotransferase (APT) family kinase protein